MTALSGGGSWTEEVEQKNRTRELIRTFFNPRRCKQLIRPAEEEEELNGLQNPDSPGIRPEFLQQVPPFAWTIARHDGPNHLGL